jgi:thiamine-phosphate pyrophosphorylase
MRKYYFINKLDTNTIDKQDKKTNIIYREGNSVKANEKEIIKIKKFCKKKLINFYLSNDVKLAIKLNLDGVYISAFNHSFKHLAYSCKKNFEIIGSAHNIKELIIKKKQKSTLIFISPIFKKKNKNALGLYRYNNIKKLFKLKFAPLGGINESNLRLIKMLDADSFAAISYFTK